MIDYKTKYHKYKRKYVFFKKTLDGGGYDDNNNYDFEKKQKKRIFNKLTILCNDNNCVVRDDGVYIYNDRWTWEIIKKHFCDKPDIMEKYCHFRKNVVDELIENIFDYFSCDDVLCQQVASGSVGADANLMSDYDLTIVNQNLKTSEIIQMFNSIIMEVFGATPAEALDTNLYGYSCIIENSILFKNKKTWSLIPFDNTKYYLKQRKKNIDQDCWAIKRLSLFNKKNTITINNKQIIEWIKLDENNINHLTFKKRSELYIEKMSDFEKVLKQYNDDNMNKDNKKHVVDTMINCLSYMNYYGDETYFTTGSFIHVVGTMFYYHSRPDIDKINILTYQQLIHSMIENLAYFMHTMDKKKDVIIGSKYMERFMNAYKLFLIKKSENIPSNISLLLTLLHIIKKYYRNRTDNEIMNYENNNNVHKLKTDKIKELDELLFNILENIVSDVISIDNKNSFYIYVLATIIKSCITPNYTNIIIDNSNQNHVIFDIHNE